MNGNSIYTIEEITEKVKWDLNEEYTMVSVEQKYSQIKLVGVREKCIKEPTNQYWKQ